MPSQHVASVKKVNSVWGIIKNGTGNKVAKTIMQLDVHSMSASGIFCTILVSTFEKG